MRNHGWELPYHPLQTVAVAVFSGLSFSFYVFFIPFVGSSVLKFHIYATFSPVVLAVFLLYVRCAGCDPADPGVHDSKRAARAKLKAKEQFSLTPDEKDESWLCLSLSCCKKDEGSAERNKGETLLYCSICEAEISKNSKHCRACDKCVHEFDHHCRWLNNCVGKRNYRSFVSLMVACILLLVIVWSTGIGVLVRCFSQKSSFEKEIVHRLGSSFSRVPYIIVVVFLSLLAMLGTIPLCQLFFFHLILIHKGITTYDYILAVRERGNLEHDTAEGDGFNSLTSSPASSNATGVSGYSSAGAVGLHRGVFCTPPRMFVEHQQKVLALSGDLESHSGPAKLTKKATSVKVQQPHKKVSVGINPWKLARLNAEEAAKIAALAREASATNIVRGPISKGSSQVTETEADSSLESSRNVSGEITVAGNRYHRRKHHDLANLTSKERWLLMKERRGKAILTSSRPGTVNGSPQSMVLPLPVEARNGFKCSPSRFSGEFRSSYPGSQLASPEMTFQQSPIPPGSTTPPAAAAAAAAAVPEVCPLQRSYSTDGYEASAGESGDETTTGQLNLKGLVQTLIKSNLDASVVNPNEKVAVWEADGNLVKPRTSSGSRSSGSRGSRNSRAESGDSSSGSRAEANILKHIRKERPELGDRLSVSPDVSTFASPFASPLLEVTRSKNGRTSDAPTKTLKQSLSTGKKATSSTKKRAEPGVFHPEPVA